MIGRVLLWVYILTLITIGTASATQYVVSDLGTLGGDWSQALDINSCGQIVGSARTLSGGTVACLWDAKVAHKLDCLPGFTRGAANAINDYGEIVGWSATYDYGYRACSWGNGVRELPMISAAQSVASGINNGGQVVGGLANACLWENDVPRILGMGRAYAINDSGVVVGQHLLYAAKFDSTGIHTAWPLPSDRLCRALAVNASGVAVGVSYADQFEMGPPHAFLWKGDSIVALPTLGGEVSYASDINNNGQIVGYSSTSSGIIHACLWDESGIHDLGGPFGMSYAYAINDYGQIVGQARFSQHENYHAALWQPVPEPTSVAVILSGLCVLAGLRKRS